MATATMKRTAGNVGLLQLAITVLVGATALVHLSLGIGMGMIAATQPAAAASMGGVTAVSILAALFVCNFGGYAVLGTARYLTALRRFQRVIRWTLVGYTALTVVAYFAIAQSHSIDPFGLSDKAVEIALIALLVIEGRRAR
jgi:hypothetical protein